MNNKNLVILVGAIVVVTVAVAIFLSFSGKNPTVNTTQTNEEQAQKTQESTAATTERVFVTVTDKGFEPKEITIKEGTQVVWTNNSDSPVTVNSDGHPTHLLWPFLNLGEFDSGQSVSVKFATKGKYTYHNHLNANQTGTVIVE